MTSTGPGPTFVTSNQSEPYGELPLPHGVISETTTLGSTTPPPAMRPGEPVSAPFAARNAPFTPTTLSVETSGSGSTLLPAPAALSNVKPVVDAGTLMPVTRLPAASNRLTLSPPVLKPMPLPL